ncbi:MAG: helix-turn-helix transcriptional regulator [Pseudomonadota bacterium]
MQQHHSIHRSAVANDAECVYVVAALRLPPASRGQGAQEPDVRAALGRGLGDLLVADNAAAVNAALAQLEPTGVPEPEAPPLTPRESEVLYLVAKGLRTSEIAGALEVSAHTVNTHLRHLFRKLGANTRSEAVFEATRLALIDPFRARAGETLQTA